MSILNQMIGRNQKSNAHAAMMQAYALRCGIGNMQNSLFLGSFANQIATSKKSVSIVEDFNKYISECEKLMS